jgi:hypothetical protein
VLGASRWEWKRCFWFRRWSVDSWRLWRRVWCLHPCCCLRCLDGCGNFFLFAAVVKFVPLGCTT